jgi:hypothetical protein
MICHPGQDVTHRQMDRARPGPGPVVSASGSKIAEERIRASGLPIPVSTRPVPPAGHQVTKRCAK